LIVAGFIASLKVAVTAALGQTAAAPFNAISEITLGTHEAVPVVKLHTKLLARASPYALVAPVVTAAV
jgi:hypothetical protein